LIWRMPAACPECPFTNAEVRASLHPDRFAEICRDLLKGRHFICHKSINYDQRDRGTEKGCAGAIDWQAQRGIKADLVQIMERLGMRARGAK
jgi:hypothetical protein